MATDGASFVVVAVVLFGHVFSLVLVNYVRRIVCVRYFTVASSRVFSFILRKLFVRLSPLDQQYVCVVLLATANIVMLTLSGVMRKSAWNATSTTIAASHQLLTPT